MWETVRHAAMATLGALVCCSSPGSDANSPADADAEPCTAEFTETLVTRSIEAVDLLFVVDGTMGDHAPFLAKAIPDVVRELIAPPCIDASGARVFVPSREPCPEGARRSMAPLESVHVGFITTNLGSLVPGVCSKPWQNDRGRLVGSLERATDVVTHEGLGFLKWEHPAGSGDLETFLARVEQLALRVGDAGCELAQPLEALYRFLADPAPPLDTVMTATCSSGGACIVASGVDEILLEQRSAFLRPDALVAAVFVTNKNDCSLAPSAEQYRALERTLAGETGPLNLFCYDQTAKFGEDFRYPVDRYRTAFSARVLCPARSDLAEHGCPDADGDGRPDTAPNPFFRDEHRPLQLGGVIGVPWQHLENDVRHDALMVESILPRTGEGSDGSPLAPPSAGYLENAANGHERLIPDEGDLQYACIAPLPQPKDCSGIEDPERCPCTGSGAETNPVCQQPDDTYAPLQLFARAYPSLRLLELLREQPTPMIGSICSRSFEDVTKADYGFRSGLGALSERLGATLAGRCYSEAIPALTLGPSGEADCAILSTLAVPSCECRGEQGWLTPLPAAAVLARAELERSGLCGAGAQRSCEDVCLCELPQLRGGPLTACQSDAAPYLQDPASGEELRGWCSVDPAVAGNADLVRACPPEASRILRFLGLPRRSEIVVACGLSLCDSQALPPR
jgi:hypothetical protein